MAGAPHKRDEVVLETGYLPSLLPHVKKNGKLNSKYTSIQIDCAICSCRKLAITDDPDPDKDPDSQTYEEWSVLPCGHMFGAKCITKWLNDARETPKCPLCNSKVIFACGHRYLPPSHSHKFGVNLYNIAKEHDLVPSGIRRSLRLLNRSITRNSSASVDSIDNDNNNHNMLSQNCPQCQLNIHPHIQPRTRSDDSVMVRESSDSGGGSSRRVYMSSSEFVTLSYGRTHTRDRERERERERPHQVRSSILLSPDSPAVPENRSSQYYRMERREAAPPAAALRPARAPSSPSPPRRISMAAHSMMAFDHPEIADFDDYRESVREPSPPPPPIPGLTLVFRHPGLRSYPPEEQQQRRDDDHNHHHHR